MISSAVMSLPFVDGLHDNCVPSMECARGLTISIWVMPLSQPFHSPHFSFRAAMPHLVYSDGLAAISIFIEPKVRELSGTPLSSQGAVHIFKRVHGDFVVTALGEAPAATVMQFANAMEPRGAVQK